ncbi:uncharacterized protein LOC115008374 [Cottoperca gobio]|uniref:Uncharacterized protein LOC115008374 n=1 Tax=Cottoperca gobio TaxID=56716 RepID=A0A6J2PNT4_COTGO|nr:uncharacterized protein LOC115008374 [Cottoperca gobio]XP_029287822.1 uncharacterized protein LOC115008374 [Cottoperca gobio]
MVQWQLCTIEHLMNSGFGCPFPRHGLQLLFWFANHCVTCELNNCVVIMQLVSGCLPERGFYGFHLFGNIEELLPVMNRPRKRKSKRPVVYFEVGNLNTETYPASANLPTYVRENYDLDGNFGNNNIDRIIVRYQVRTRVVETVYVTEHDGAAFGSFSTARTFEIHPELIQALQSPQLDLTAFLTQTGYWGDMQVVQANNMEEIHYLQPSAQQMFNITYSGSTARTQRDSFNQQLDVNGEPFSYDQQVQYIVNVTSHNSRFMACNSEVQLKYRKRKANKRPRALRTSYWQSGREKLYKDFDEVKKGKEGGGSFVKILLIAGMLYLTAKSLSWLRSRWKLDLNENILRMLPWRTPSYQYHILLDYVY